MAKNPWKPWYQDDGKMLLGADGSALLAVDGTVLLAGYPMPTRLDERAATVRYKRDFQKDNIYVNEDEIWDQDWYERSSVYEMECALSYSNFNYHDYRAVQEVRKYKISEFIMKEFTFLDVPWTRITNIQVKWQLDSSGSISNAIPCVLYKGVAEATAPSGNNEPWENSGWTQLASVTPDTQNDYDLAHGVINLPVVDGEPPEDLWLAMAVPKPYDVTDGRLETGAQLLISFLIVYNTLRTV